MSESENSSWSMPIRNGSRYVVTIDDRGVAFRDWYVEANAITGIAFGGSAQGGLLSKVTNWCHIRAQYKTYKISSDSTGVAMHFHREDNVHLISKTIAQWIYQKLLIKTMSSIVLDGKEVSISELVFSRKGIRRKGVFSTDIIPWSRNPRIRDFSESSFLNRTRRDWSLVRETGVIEVCVAHPISGKIQGIGFASSAEMNGFLVPAIIAELSGRLLED